MDDPALVVLYKQLREKSLQTLRGAIMVAPRVEWEFVVHTARMYERMGCDFLALDLGKYLNPINSKLYLGGAYITSKNYRDDVNEWYK